MDISISSEELLNLKSIKPFNRFFKSDYDIKNIKKDLRYILNDFNLISINSFNKINKDILNRFIECEDILNLLIIALSKINWKELSRNPIAIDLLQQNLDKVDYEEFSKNSSASHILTLDKKYNNEISINLDDSHELLLEKLDCVDIKSIKPFNRFFKSDYDIKNLKKDLKYILDDFNLTSIDPFNKISKNIINKYVECENMLNLLIIALSKINWKELSRNPIAIDLLQQNLDKVDLEEFSKNSAASHILILDKNYDNEISINLDDSNKLFLEKIDCIDLYQNKSNSHILKLKNIKVIDKIIENLSKDDWKKLSSNFNAFYILQNNLDKVDWEEITKNQELSDKLLKSLNEEDWKKLSSNPKAVYILKQNLDKIDWDELYKNPNAIIILENILTKINWKEYYKPVIED